MVTKLGDNPPVVNHKVIVRYEAGAQNKPMVDTVDGLGTRIRRLLEETDTEQVDLAEYVGFRPQSLTKILAGGGTSDRNIRRIADYFDVNWLWLKYGDEADESAGNQVREPGIDYSGPKLTADEKELVGRFRAYSAKQRRALLDFLREH